MTDPIPSPFLSTETGPIKLEFLMSSDESSYDLLAGYAGAMREDAHRWHCHRETIDVFGDHFAPIVESLSGIPRGINEKETAKRKSTARQPEKVSPVPERVNRYLLRVFAQVSKETQSAIQAAALELSRTMLISPAPAVRSTVIEPMYYKRADSLLLQDLDTINEKVSKFSALVPDFILDREPSGKPLRDSLARLCQSFDSARWALED
jgi:hypothetical protein